MGSASDCAAGVVSPTLIPGARWPTRLTLLALPGIGSAGLTTAGRAWVTVPVTAPTGVAEPAINSGTKADAPTKRRFIYNRPPSTQIPRCPRPVRIDAYGLHEGLPLRGDQCPLQGTLTLFRSTTRAVIAVNTRSSAG